MRSGSTLSQLGLTLVELLVAMVCMGLVMAGVYQVFFSQSKSATIEQSILDMQTNARAGMDQVTSVIRHAGYGCRDSFLAGQTMTGDEPDGNNSVVVDYYLWDIQDNSVVNATTLNPDQLVVVYGFRRNSRVTTAIVPTAPTRTLAHGTVDGPTVTASTTDFDNYISLFPHMEGDVFYQVNATGSGTYTLDRKINAINSGGSIFVVSPSRIQLTNGTLEIKNFTYTGGSNWEVTSGFEDLQFEYTNGTVWMGMPASLRDVIGVRVWLLARADRPEPGYTNSRTYSYAGQTVGPFNDNIHRWLISETVWLRNWVK